MRKIAKYHVAMIVGYSNYSNIAYIDQQRHVEIFGARQDHWRHHSGVH